MNQESEIPSAGEVPAPVLRGPRTIVVADDEEIVRDILTRALARDGHEILGASDGEEAIRRIREAEAVHVVITDIKMPTMDGMEVLRRTKELSEDIEVLILTAYASTETAVEAVRHGAFDYIIKPFEHVDVVTRRVDQALEKQRLVLENRELTEKLADANRQLKEIVRRRSREVTEAAEDEKERRLEAEEELQDLEGVVTLAVATGRRVVDELRELADQLDDGLAERLRSAASELESNLVDALPAASAEE